MFWIDVILFQLLLLITMAAVKLTASSVTSSLKSGEYRIRFCSKGKSDIWKEFGIVVDLMALNWTLLLVSHQALAYSSHFGTSALKLHKCRIIENQTTLTCTMEKLINHPDMGSIPHQIDQFRAYLESLL